MRRTACGTMLLAALCAAQAVAAPALPERPAPTPVRASKIVLVGDSTTAVHSGWGGAFCAHHVTSALTCSNMGRGGRSTYSYRAEGSWALVEAEMRGAGYADTWVLLQFGHNDQPGKPGRSTDLQREFPDNLRRYVRAVRAAGAHPVLLTPLTRRQFADGVLIDDLAPWADSVRAVAAELDVPLVDLHARSRTLVQALGPVAALRLAQAAASPAQVSAALAGTTLGSAPAPATVGAAPAAASVAQNHAAAEPMGQPKVAFDYTHLGPDGAALFSAVVSAELARNVPALRPLLVP